MNKESKYNIAVQYNDEVLLYNTLSNAVCRLSAEEFDTVKELLNNTDLFEKEYPDVFTQMKKDGYIVDADLMNWNISDSKIECKYLEIDDFISLSIQL